MSLSATEIDSRIGAHIRALRLERRLTLEGLAERAEVSRAMLSRIERGQSSPTAQLLARVCDGLEMTLAGFFAAAEAGCSPVSRRAEQPVWQDPQTRYVRRAVSPPRSGSAVQITEVEFPAGSSIRFDNRAVAAADQHVWVLDGRIDVELGAEAFRLEVGDCLLMRFGRPVMFRNPAGEPARYAVVVSLAGGSAA